MVDWKNEGEVEMELQVWIDLKDSIIDLFYKHGADTWERNCQFDYNLRHDPAD